MNAKNFIQKQKYAILEYINRLNKIIIKATNYLICSKNYIINY